MTVFNVIYNFIYAITHCPINGWLNMDWVDRYGMVVCGGGSGGGLRICPEHTNHYSYSLLVPMLPLTTAIYII